MGTLMDKLGDRAQSRGWTGDKLAEMLRNKRRPGNDPEVRAAVEAQDALPGTGQDSAADVRRWREARW
jgi:hypothetical protein